MHLKFQCEEEDAEGALGTLASQSSIIGELQAHERPYLKKNGHQS